MRTFACKIKAYLFIPQDWGTEGVEALKMLFYIKVLTLRWKDTDNTMPTAIMLVIMLLPP